MSSPQLIIALAGRKAARGPEGAAFLRICRVAGELCVPVFAESGEEALALFRELRLAGFFFPESLSGSFLGRPREASTSPRTIDTVAADGPGNELGFDAAAAARRCIDESRRAGREGELDFSACRAAAALGLIRGQT
ncbi:MAG: hypothetical protein M0Z80_03760, partial [Treponema sp.]|nr:hypothetical protein [Treponema sp.]